MISSVLLSLGLAWQALSPEAILHVRAGMAAQKQGNLTLAIEEFRKVSELAPNLPAAFVNLGAAYLQNHDYMDAIAPLKHAVEMKDDLIGAQQMLGYALLVEGYAAEAIPHLQRAGVTDALGIAQLQAGDLPDAVANLERALQKTPKDPELLYYLSQASGQLAKNSADALESGFPHSARAHQSLAENYAALRRVPEAEKEFAAALQADPATAGAHLELGELYAGASEWAKAADEYRAEAKLRPGDAEAGYRLGSALLELGKVSEARAELARANQLRPQMPETLYLLGKSSSLAGESAEAEKDWKQQLSIEPKGTLAAQAHFGLAGLYRKQGRSADANQEMQQFEQLKTGSTK